MTKNNNKVIFMKEKIEQKKHFLEQNKPTVDLKTSCVFKMFGVTYNLHIMNEFELQVLFSWLRDLNNPSLKLECFTVQDWMTDIMAISLINDYYNQLHELKSFEQRFETAALNNDEKELEELFKII